jgi:small subunit ribosomal protein S15
VNFFQTLNGVLMAKLHSKKRGKAGTKRAKTTLAPKWVSAKKAEISEIIVKMAKEGTPASKIGLALRDQHGVPAARAVVGKRIATIMKEQKVAPSFPEDLISLIRKAVRVRGHLKSSKKDVHNKVKLGHIESKISRLAKYYSNKGVIPKGWRYDPDQANLIVK